MRYFVLTDKGDKRQNNEDALLLTWKADTLLIQKDIFMEAGEIAAPFLALVSDGMGGYEAGEVASQMACEAYNKYFNALNKDSLPSSEDLSTQLKAVFMDVDLQLANMAKSDPAKNRIGATVVGLFFSEATGLLTFHAGDSRVWSFKNGYLKSLTVDHNVQNVLLVQHAPSSKALTNSLGGGSADNFLEVQAQLKFSPQEGDGLVLTSDGVHEYIDMDLFEEAFKLKSKEEMREKISAAIRSNSAPDNFTVIAIFW